MKYSLYSNSGVRMTPVRRSRIGRHEKIEGFCMAIIPFLGFTVFTVFPLVLSVIVSFNDLHSYELSSMTFVGFGNYVKLFQNPMFKKAIVNTLIFSLCVPINLTSQLFLANLLSKPLNKHFAKAARLVLYIPTVIGGLAISLIWNWILEPNFGVFNTILSSLGLEKIGFTTTEKWFMPSVLLIKWWSVGMNVLVLEAALANVDATLKEAARMDGASERTVFFRITLPQISPMLIYTFTMSFIDAVGEMATVQILSNGGLGPNGAAITLSYLMYRMVNAEMFTQGFGVGSALGLLIGIFTFGFLEFSNWAVRKWLSFD